MPLGIRKNFEKSIILPQSWLNRRSKSKTTGHRYIASIICAAKAWTTFLWYGVFLFLFALNFDFKNWHSEFGKKAFFFQEILSSLFYRFIIGDRILAANLKTTNMRRIIDICKQHQKRKKNKSALENG